MIMVENGNYFDCKLKFLLYIYEIFNKENYILFKDCIKFEVFVSEGILKFIRVLKRSNIIFGFDWFWEIYIVCVLFWLFIEINCKIFK